MNWVWIILILFALSSLNPSKPRRRKSFSKTKKASRPKNVSKGHHRRNGVLYNSYRVGDTNYSYNHKTHKLTKRKRTK